MRSGFSLGRVFGIKIRIDWSWLFIFFLIAWNLGTSFNQFNAAWGVGLSWALAILAAILFFLSVLAHELAHSVVANSQGVPVRSITLFLFGGVSNIQREGVAKVKGTGNHGHEQEKPGRGADKAGDDSKQRRKV